MVSLEQHCVVYLDNTDLAVSTDAAAVTAARQEP
jgi:hypothetical protein